MPESYDLFVSYAHADDHDGWVSALVDAIQQEHARFSPNPLRLFFDKSGIHTMQQWEHRILGGLRHCKLMLAVLSPAYFASTYCRKEWERYLDRELELALAGEGVAPLYIVTAPDFDDDAQAELDRWLADMRTRQFRDIRKWRDGGPQALQEEDVRNRLRELEQRLSLQLVRAEAACGSPTTIPPHNPNFVGRVAELRDLRARLIDGGIGAITAVHGIGGIGKSALAFEYAHTFGPEYPGGRFLLHCAGVTDLRLPIVGLAEQIGVTLSEEERRDLDAGHARVRGALEQGEPCLLLLDNVDRPELLAPATRALYLPGGDRVHVLATTRLEPGRLPGLGCLQLDTLPVPDAVRLMEKYRAFETEADEQAAARVAERLGGLALAVEAVAVFLWQHPEVELGGMLARLEAEGLEGLEGIAGDEHVELSRHQEKLISVVLEPTLESLSPAESLTLGYAALLPADWIALSWLRELAGREFPELVAEPRPGYADPWADVARRLEGLRLLVPTEERRIARMHRLVQEVVLRRVGPELPGERREALTEHALARGGVLLDGWVDRSEGWEIDPLARYSELLLDAGDLQGTRLANLVQEPLGALGRHTELRDLLQGARSVQENASPPDHPDLAPTYSNLALAEQNLGNLPAARELMRKAVAINEQVYEPDHPALAVSYSNLAMVERDLGNLSAARELMLRAIAVWEKAHGPDYPTLAVSYSNLAMVERDLGNLPGARELMLKAIAIDEQAYEPDHPNLAVSYSNLAAVEWDLGNLPAARELMLKAIAIEQNTFEPDHPSLARDYSNLAMVEYGLGNLVEARELMLKAIAIEQQAYEPDQPALAVSYSNLAMVEQDLGNLPAARELLLKAIAIDEQAFEPDHPNLGVSYSNLATVERDLGNLPGAWALMLKAIAIDEQAYEPDHPSLARDYSNLALVEQALGNLSAARELLTRALGIFQARLGPDHPNTRIVARNLVALPPD